MPSLILVVSSLLLISDFCEDDETYVFGCEFERILWLLMLGNITL
jgi:hypothetical protein